MAEDGKLNIDSMMVMILGSGRCRSKTICIRRSFTSLWQKPNLQNMVKDRIMDSGGHSFMANIHNERVRKVKDTHQVVRYITNLKRRLIIVGQLDEKGYHVDFRDQQWKVTKGSLVVAHRNKRGSLIGMSMLASKGNVPDVRFGRGWDSEASTCFNMLAQKIKLLVMINDVNERFEEIMSKYFSNASFVVITARYNVSTCQYLDKAYGRFQKLISQLRVHGAPISKEDINKKFLRSLPPSWNQIALIMRISRTLMRIDI
ncbi:hypothetical protein Tco_1343495 [Tanacetum coccineum]